MNRYSLHGLVWLVVLFFSLSMPALAAKGGGGNSKGHSGNGSIGKSEKEMNKEKLEHEYQSQHEKGDKKLKKQEKSEKGKSDEASGLNKQSEKKMEQERKEEGKGSETGQKMREEHSRKWWKFWE